MHQLLEHEEEEDYDEGCKKICFITICQIAVKMDEGHN